MAISMRIDTVKMISVHEIPEGVKASQHASVQPTTVWVPSVHEEAKVLRRECVVHVRDRGMKKSEKIEYAEARTHAKLGKYLLLTIPEGKAFRYGTGEQQVDEYGNAMQPAVERAVLHVRASEIANEIESQLRYLGVATIKGDEPTDAELTEAFSTYRVWVLAQIRSTNAGYARFGSREVTRQSLALAEIAFKRGWITTLPEWASIDPEARGADIMPCVGCGKSLRNTVIKCDACGAIYDWKRAIEYGIKSPSDVPPSKRVEAGLDPAPPSIAVAKVGAPHRVPASIPVLESTLTNRKE